MGKLFSLCNLTAGRNQRRRRFFDSVRISLVVATLILFAETSAAARRGGIQAVVFPKWNAASVRNLADAVNESQAGQFELSQAPFFGGSGRWENTTAFLARVNARFAVHGTFFLSFHTDQSGYDVARRAADPNEYLLRPQASLGGLAPFDRLVSVIISPQTA
jgi:hypothetical protein